MPILADVGNQQISPLSNELLFRMTPSAATATHLVFMQSGEPGSLYCADESDGEALRACEQTMESPLRVRGERHRRRSRALPPTARPTRT